MWAEQSVSPGVGNQGGQAWSSNRPLEWGPRIACALGMLDAERLPRSGALLVLAMGSDAPALSAAFRAMSALRPDLRLCEGNTERGRQAICGWLTTGGAALCATEPERDLPIVIRLALQNQSDVLLVELGEAGSSRGGAEVVGRRSVVARVSLPIRWQTLERLRTDFARLAYTRWRCHALSQRRQGREDGLAGSVAPARALVPPVPVRVLEAEMRALRAKERLIVSELHVVCAAKAGRIPHLLREIGRLREASSRAAGQSVGCSIERDRFDDDCTHLFVWHRVERTLVAALRLGSSKQALAKHGPRGLYASTLFDLGDAACSGLTPGLELSRVVVKDRVSGCPELWHGLSLFVAQHPRYERLFGVLPLPASYSRFSQELMARALGQGGHLHPLAGSLRPKQPVVPERPEDEPSGIEVVLDDVERWSSVVADAEPDGKGMPLVVREALRLGGKFLGFAVASNFSRILAGLVVVNLRYLDARLFDLEPFRPVIG